MTDTSPLTDQQLDHKAEIAHLRDLLAKENARANAAIDREEAAEQAALEAQQERDKLIRWHREDSDEMDKQRATIARLRARRLTASEYNRAWHAVEGAAGEEGADPGTVLHAVLDRLGIGWQDAARPAAVVVGGVSGTGQ